MTWKVKLKSPKEGEQYCPGDEKTKGRTNKNRGEKYL